eukprot:366561-Chlamydomonas_euryale.AAC.12
MVSSQPQGNPLKPAVYAQLIPLRRVALPPQRGRGDVGGAVVVAGELSMLPVLQLTPPLVQHRRPWAAPLPPCVALVTMATTATQPDKSTQTRSSGPF